MAAKWRCRACGHMGLMIYQTTMDRYVGTNEDYPGVVDGHPRWLLESGIPPGQAGARRKPIQCPKCKAQGRENFEEMDSKVEHIPKADNTSIPGDRPPLRQPTDGERLGGLIMLLRHNITAARAFPQQVEINMGHFEFVCREMERWFEAFGKDRVSGLPCQSSSRD